MIRNVVLLTLDALAARHVGHLGYDLPTTPRLDEFAADWQCYTTCIAQSSHTRESMPSLFASAYPTQLGSVGTVPLTHPTLPEVLSDAGFDTAGFHSNPYLSRAYGFDRGFDTFEDGLPLADNRVLTFLHRVLNHFQRQPYTRAKTLNEKGKNWLAGSDADRRFLWLHYMDPHGPYQPPTEFQRDFRDELVGSRRAKKLWRRTVDEPESITGDERDTLIDLYDAEIRYADAMLGQFVDDLAERDLLDESLIVVAADHGDLFDAHDLYGHPRQLYEGLIHVPLLVRNPRGKDCTVERPVENVDIAPTILDAVDVTTPAAFAGQSLSAGSKTDDTDPLTDVAVSEARGEGDDSGIVRTVVRTSDEKLHVEADTDSGEILGTELYDLAVDSTEESPIEDADRRERLLDLYAAHRSRVNDAADDDQPHTEDIDGVVEDRLRNLGYK